MANITASQKETLHTALKKWYRHSINLNYHCEMDLVRAHEFRVASAVSGQILQTNDEITFVELHIWI